MAARSPRRWLPHGGEDFLDAGLILLRQPVKQRREHAALAVQRQFQIVPDGMAFKHRRLLEFSADAELGNIRLVLLGEVDAVFEQHRAGIRPRLAGDDVHHRRLAGAIRADDGAQFPGSTTKEREFSALNPSKETDTPSR